MSRNDSPTDAPAQALLGRRNLLQLGGFTVAAGAILAACGGEEAGLGRVGLATPTTKLADAVVNDVVYLRTASSMEHSIAGVYDTILGDPSLVDDANLAALQRFRSDHGDHAATYERLTSRIGGTPWKVPNPRIENTVVTPVFTAIKGAKATTPEGLDTPPSDDPKRDALNFLHALETIAGQSYQALVPLLSDPSQRAEAIAIGARSARRSAVLAIASTGRPHGYISPGQLPAEVAPTTTAAAVAPSTIGQDIAGASTTTSAPAVPVTPIPPLYAITTQFGGLAALPLVVGAPNDAGTRTTIILDTPSLNTFVYEYMEPTAG